MKKRSFKENVEFSKSILIGVLFILLLGVKFLHKCPVCPTYENKVTIDTVYFPSKERVLDIPVPKPNKISKKKFNDNNGIIGIASNIDSTSIRNDSNLYYNEYEQSFEDSLIKGISKITTDGTLIKNTFVYTPKFPKQITITNTIVEKFDLEPYEKKRTHLFLGFDTGGNKNSFSFTPTATLQTKQRYNITARYDMINKSYYGGLSFRLF